MSTNTDQPIIDESTIDQPLGTPTASHEHDTKAGSDFRSAANTIRHDLSKKLNDPTAVYVAIGASDFVAERARQVAATAVRQGAELADRARSLNTSASVDATDVPRLVLSRALKVAGQVEAVYEDLASRGRDVAERARDGAGGNDLVRRAVATLTRRADVVTTGSGAVVVGETVQTTEVVETVEPLDTTADSTVDATLDAPVDTTVDTAGTAAETPDDHVSESVEAHVDGTDDTRNGDHQSPTDQSN